MPSRRGLRFSRGQYALACGVFAAITLVFFFPLLRGETFADVAGREQQTYPWAGAVGSLGYETTLHYDQDDTIYPWQVFMNRELRAGRLPLWNPYSFGGAPFLANGQSGVLYPPRLALAYTVPPARVHDMLLSSHFFFAGVAMLLLLGYVGVSFWGSLVGGVAWMINTFALSWQALEHYVVIEVGLPVAVLLAHALVRRRSWGAAWGLAVVLGLLLVGGNALFAELAVVVVLAYGVALALADDWRDVRAVGGAALRLGSATALALGLAAVSILPTLALASESARVSLTYHELSSFALSWSDLQYLFRWPPDPYKSDPYHHDLFAGSLVGVLALVGIAARSFTARFAAILGALTVLFMVHTPVTYVVRAVLPGFDNFKPLARAAFILMFAAAVLAAYGFDIAATWLSRRPRARSYSVAAALAAVVVVSTVAQQWLWKRDVMLHQPASRAYLYPETPLTRTLEREPVSRLLPTDPSFRGSTAMIYGLPSAGGYESLLPARTEDFWRVLGERVAPSALTRNPLTYAYHPLYELAVVQPGLLARASVSHVFAAPGDVVTSVVPRGLRLEHGGSDGRVFAVRRPLPLAYVVGACEEAPSTRAALERFISDDFDPGGRVILERSSLEDAGLTCGGTESGRAGTADVIERATSSMSIAAHVRRPGWLVVAESWDKGWSATVDGRDAEVFPADSALRAVRVGPGEHLVRLTYQPDAYQVGLVGSSLSLGLALGSIGFVLARRVRRRPQRREPNEQE